ncbi:MAG: ARMT1-like domain-containing protein [Methanoregula sp.]|uniref:damage-control phosphatase ARMT1 family protein n=1 Tax=Methanoregula sp. TaxID=2052170 RepID=UPI003BB1C321
MKITESCIECLISRVQLECGMVGADSLLTEQTIDSCRNLLFSLKDSSLSHPQIASCIHRHAYEMLDNPDPFLNLKKQGNAEAVKVCREVRNELSGFRDYALASVIGNTFDYGVKGHSVTSNFSAFFRQEFRKGFVIDDTDAVFPLTARVVYLCDNCGEIVFDRLLIQYLKSQGSHVTVAVKARPVLNDATLEDAHRLGLDRIVDCLTTNCEVGEIGFCPENAPPVLSDAISRCTLIIAKGMANFEALFERNDLPPVAYLMAAKCQPVADEAKVPIGSKIALLRN